MSKINQTTWIVALSTIDSGISNELAEPDFPGIVTITNPEGGEIINFTAGTEGSSPITSYAASVIPSGPTATVVSADLAVGGYVELSDFTFDTDYIVSISAVNEFGQGEAAFTNSFIIQDLYNEASGGTETIVYDYNGTGERWKVHTFESNGTLDIAASPQNFSTLIVAGGNGANYYVGTPASGGQVIENIGMLSNSQVSVVVGSGGAGGQGGNAQSGGVSQFGSDTAVAGLSNVQVNSTITGTSTPYGGSGSYPIARGRGGMGVANTGEYGTSGIVVIAYEISSAFNVASGGTETIVDDYNGSGQQWKVHDFGNSGGTFTVESSTRPFRVMAAGQPGGGGPVASGRGGGGGGGGEVLDVEKSFTAGEYPVTAYSVNGVSARSGGAGNPGWSVGAASGIGGASGNGNPGGPQSSDSWSAGGGGGAGGAGANSGGNNCAGGGGGISTNISGSNQTLGTGGGGGAQNNGCSGQAGKVVIAYQIGVSTLAQIRAAEKVRKSELRKQQLEEKAFQKQEALKEKLRLAK